MKAEPLYQALGSDTVHGLAKQEGGDMIIENSNSHNTKGDDKGIEKLLKQIDVKISDEKEGKNKPMVPFSKLLWSQADRADKTYIVLGFISATLCGFGLPSFVFLFGNIADSFGGQLNPDAVLDAITGVSKSLTLIGLAIWFGSYIFYAFFVIASESIG